MPIGGPLAMQTDDMFLSSHSPSEELFRQAVEERNVALLRNQILESLLRERNQEINRLRSVIRSCCKLLESELQDAYKL